MLKRFATFLAMGILAVGVVACGGGDGDNGGSSNGGSSGGGSVSMEFKEFEFVPANIEANAGETITLNIKNTGAVTHDIVWDDLGGEKVEKKLDSGQSGTLTVTAPSQTGEYDFYCSEPGHKESGMVGTLTVK